MKFLKLKAISFLGFPFLPSSDNVNVAKAINFSIGKLGLLQTGCYKLERTIFISFSRFWKTDHDDNFYHFFSVSRSAKWTWANFQKYLKNILLVPVVLTWIFQILVQVIACSTVAINSNRFFFCRGVYLACLLYHEDKVLVTNEDFLPVIEVDENYPKKIHNDFHWFFKVWNIFLSFVFIFV